MELYGIISKRLSDNISAGERKDIQEIYLVQSVEVQGNIFKTITWQNIWRLKESQLTLPQITPICMSGNL